MNKTLVQKTKQVNQLSALQTLSRKSITRTKIQLGGLLVKAKLMQDLGIELGEDLQLDPASWDKCALLLGILLEARENYLSLQYNNPEAIEKLKTKGLMLLKYDTHLAG